MRTDVQSALQSHGVTSESAVERVKAMSDDEVAQLAGRIDQCRQRHQRATQHAGGLPGGGSQQRSQVLRPAQRHGHRVQPVRIVVVLHHAAQLRQPAPVRKLGGDRVEGRGRGLQHLRERAAELPEGRFAWQSDARDGSRILLNWTETVT